MTTLVIYDSAYGNTAQVAKALAIAAGGEARLIGDVEASAIPRADLLLVGSPTQGGRATAAMTAWLERIPQGALEGTRIAAFDTRFAPGKSGWFLNLLMSMIGFAAPKISDVLVARGARLAAPPEGFIVTGREGPLLAGELDRATGWARALAG